MDANAAVPSVLDRVELPNSGSFQQRYPHQLSGGQQRLCDRDGDRLRARRGGFRRADDGARRRHAGAHPRGDRAPPERASDSMVYVSHNLAVVAGIADRIAVMYAGRIVEEGPGERHHRRAAATPTRAPRVEHPGSRCPAPSSRHPWHRRRCRRPAARMSVRSALCRCRVADCRRRSCRRCRTIERPPRSGAFAGSDTPARVRAPPVRSARRRLAAPAGRRAPCVRSTADAMAHRRGRDVSFSASRGECVALVGESGAGRRRSRVRRRTPRSRFRTDRPRRRSARGRSKERPHEARRRVQIVFQNPYNSLNPRESVLDAVAWAGTAAAWARAGRRRERTPSRCSSGSGSRRTIAGRYPRELSGGERQRVAIARALIARPDVLVSTRSRRRST